jgi:p-cumate 2,3-dioxygenase beta subunit
MDSDARARRLDVEDFLYHEATLLDEWRLDEWFSLFTEDARYVVPATDRLPSQSTSGNRGPEQALAGHALIDDDYSRLRGRVDRLKSRLAHREFPWSRTRRLITNVRVVDEVAGELAVSASFLVYRIRGAEAAPYVGRYLYRLRQLTLTQGDRANQGFKIRHRRAELDLEVLSDHGAVSIIL